MHDLDHFIFAYFSIIAYFTNMFCTYLADVILINYILTAFLILRKPLVILIKTIFELTNILYNNTILPYPSLGYSQGLEQ